MTILVGREIGTNSLNAVLHDAVLEDGTININQDSYAAALDRTYDVRGLANMHVEIENTNATNGLTFKIEKAKKDFSLLSDLTDADFDQDILANTNVLALVSATGTVTSASPVANTFATGTATLTSVIATDTVTINGLIYLAVSGTASEGEFDIDGDDNANAIELRNAINTDTRSGTLGDLTATASTNVVTVTTDVSGTAGNAITLTSQDATIVVSGSGTFTGGVTADTVTINSLIYTAVAGVKADNTQFSIDSTDTATAADLVDSVTNDTRQGTLADITAANVAGVVTFTSTAIGTAGNAITLASSDGTRLAVSGATLSGGVDNFSISDIIDISPESTAIRIRVRRQTSGQNATLAGSVGVD